MALFHVMLLGDDMGAPIVNLGSGELDPDAITGPDDALVIPGVPELIRQIVENLEAGMTTGPDEATWLGDPRDE